MHDLMDIYLKLLNHFGPQNWWPGDSPFEVVVGAILTQQTSWSNVEKAIHNMKEAEILSPRALVEIHGEELEALIRPSGFYRQKARHLRAFSDHLLTRHSGELDSLLSGELEEIRRELLSLQGIGPETADSILLYAGGLPSFVIDNYTLRAGQRLGIFVKKPTYIEAKAHFETHLPRDAPLFNEFHALFVELGKNYCNARKPLCGQCPLVDICELPGPKGSGITPSY